MDRRLLDMLAMIEVEQNILMVILTARYMLMLMLKIMLIMMRTCLWKASLGNKAGYGGFEN